MKLSLITLTALLATFTAAGPSKCNKYAKMIPKCARGPIKSCAHKQGCASRDYKCECKHQKAIKSCAMNPVVSKCGIGGAKKALKASKKVCKCAK